MEPVGYPLSSAQELWFSGDQGDESGFFSRRFVMANAWRIRGRIDGGALQKALDDVVERHEILRTVVVRDAKPPFQQVYPPVAVPLEFRELSVAGAMSLSQSLDAEHVDAARDLAAEQFLAEAEQTEVSPREVPLLRALLGSFDDRDSVLALIIHHSISDEWSVQAVMRDLAAFYSARTTGKTPDLPETTQYREFSMWQQAAANGAEADQARSYWREKMRGARIFAAPTERPAPEVHTEPYSALHFTVGADVMKAAATLAGHPWTSAAVTLQAAFNVLACRISGTTDQAIDTLTSGRTDRRFDHSVGALMNFLVFRTDLAGCAGFRDVVAGTRDTCAEAYAHEIPIQHIENEVPELMQPNDDPLSTNCILGVFVPPYGEAELQIGDSCVAILHRELPSPIGPWIPHGVAWALHIAQSGELHGTVQYNREELDHSTVADWAALYQRILTAGCAEPDRDWRTLT